MTTTIGPSFTQGYALCSPAGVILGHSYRSTDAAAIESVFSNPEYRDEFWTAAQAEGWSVKFVYARIFTPQFFVADILAQPEEREAC
jgi:hypothetical protein